VGVILLIIFWASVYTRDMQMIYCLFGTGLFLYGLYLMRKAYQPPPGVERFRTLRRLFGGKKKDGPG
jgi:hypothetical protein